MPASAFRTDSEELAADPVAKLAQPRLAAQHDPRVGHRSIQRQARRAPVCAERRPGADLSGFEPPEAPAVTIQLDEMRLERAVNDVLAALEKIGQFD